MTISEIILSIATTVSTSGNIAQFLHVRSLQKKAAAEADTAADLVLYKRIEFLDERVSRLEKLACFDHDCKQRK